MPSAGRDPGLGRSAGLPATRRGEPRNPLRTATPGPGVRRQTGRPRSRTPGPPGLDHPDEPRRPFSRAARKGRIDLLIAHDVLCHGGRAARCAARLERAIKIISEMLRGHISRSRGAGASTGAGHELVDDRVDVIFGLRWPVIRKPSPPNLLHGPPAFCPAIWSAVPTKWVKPCPLGLVTTSAQGGLGAGVLERAHECLHAIGLELGGSALSRSNCEKSMPDRNDMAARPALEMLWRRHGRPASSWVSSTSSALFHDRPARR